MKNIILFFTIFLLCFTANAQTSYGTGAGTQGGNSVSYFGLQAGRLSTATHNTFIGYRTGYDNTTGHSNCFVGSLTGYENTEGFRNTFNGFSAGRYNTTGNYNTLLGYRAGYKNKTGHGNVLIGYQAGYNVTGSDKLFIDNSSTNTPLIHGNFSSNDLTIYGNLNINPTDGLNAFDLFCNDNGGWNNQIRFNTNGIRHIITDNFTNDRLTIFPGFDGSASKILHLDGSMVIGSSNVNTPPNYKLYVETGILTEKVKVANLNSSDWADYVFEEDYSLNSTEEVEQFIRTNKHLPNVPSAQEVSDKGIDMVEMDATLLRQIEELWLHVIEMKKENDSLREQVEALNTNK